MRFSGLGGAGSPGDRDALVEPGRRSSEMPAPCCRSSVLGQVMQRIRLVSIARRQDPQEPPFQLLGARAKRGGGDLPRFARIARSKTSTSSECLCLHLVLQYLKPVQVPRVPLSA